LPDNWLVIININLADILLAESAEMLKDMGALFNIGWLY
jgi:hypothetical protein